MLTVAWPSRTATQAEAWRVLDLSGMTKSVRQSRGYVLSGYLYVNGNHVLNLKETVAIGKVLRFELRFPNGVVQGQTIFIVRPTLYKPRINQPDTAYRKP